MKKRILGGIASVLAAAGIGAGVLSQAGPVVTAQQSNVGTAQTVAQRTALRSGECRSIRYHIAITGQGGSNYHTVTEYRAKLKKDNVVQKAPSLETAETSAVVRAMTSIEQTARGEQQGVLKDVIPVMAGVTPTPGGELLPTPHVSSEGYGKWDDLKVVSLDTAGTSVPGGYKDYKVEFSNGRVITLRIKSSDYVPAQITVMLNQWAQDYVAANTRVTPYPIGSFWNTGQLPTAWGTNVKFVYSRGWVFVYRPGAPVPSGSTITTAPAANDDLPSEEQITYSHEVMRGIKQPW